MGRRILAGLVGLALALVTLGGVTSASASQLGITTEPFAAFSSQLCSTDLISVTAAGHVAGNNYSQVAFTNIPAACAGQSLTYVLYRNNGQILRQGTSTAVSGSLTVNASSNYNIVQVDGARVLLGTWRANAAWFQPGSVPTDPPPGQCWAMLHSTGERTTDTNCTPVLTPAGVQYVDQWNGGPGNYRDVTMQLIFNPNSYVVDGNYIGEFHAFTKWRVTVDMTASAISSGINLSGAYYIYAMQNTVLAPGEDCSDLGAITLQESGTGYNDTGGFTISSSPINWKSPSSLLCTGS